MKSRFVVKVAISVVSALILISTKAAYGKTTPKIVAGHLSSVRISGVVVDSMTGNMPISKVRVMLFDSSLSFFSETRTDNAGAYNFNNVPLVRLLLGTSAPGHQYKQVALNPIGADTTINVVLHPEVEPGRWTIVGSTAPEYLDASNSGALLPDGRLFFCHNTLDPILFDPESGVSTTAPGSSSHQGCHVSSLLLNGDIIFIGGQGSDDFRDAVRTTKVYRYGTNSWTLKDSLYEERWYPSLARFADGRLLVMGGGQSPDAARTKTCEIYDPAENSYVYTDSMQNGSEYTPTLLLPSGDVLITWYPPQIYSLESGSWRITGQFVQPNRFWPGHSDHSMILLPDGRPMVCGIYRGSLSNPSMVELFDPVSETWSLGATPAVTRSQPEVVMLPNGKVLCAAGRLEDNNPAIPTSQGYTKLTDIYDPPSNSWRSVATLPTFHEYHATTLLVPDGRVITAGGSNLNFTGPTNYNIEAYEPPYLFRGPRPSITALSATELERSGNFNLNVTYADSITQLILIGVNAVTHWVDGGVPRYISLPFTQNGTLVTGTIPSNQNISMLGYYMLFALVDDVPSEGRIVRIVPSTSSCCVGIRGNVNNSGGITVADLTYLVSFLFNSGPAPACPDEANVNGLGSITVADLTSLVQYLFNSGPQPPPCP